MTYNLSFSWIRYILDQILDHIKYCILNVKKFISCIEEAYIKLRWSESTVSIYKRERERKREAVRERERKGARERKIAFIQYIKEMTNISTTKMMIKYELYKWIHSLDDDTRDVLWWYITWCISVYVTRNIL